MLRHQQSLTMRHKNTRSCRRFQRQFLNILMLSIMWTMLFTQTMARPNIETLLSNKPANDLVEQQQQQQQDLYLQNEIISNINNEKLFHKMQKYHHNQPSYLYKWPGLRDLVSHIDYDDNNGLEDSNEFLSSHFFERLRQLAAPRTDYYDDEMRVDTIDTTLAPQIKKNVQFHKQYMSPCHFKICNMGRKRDARFFKNN